MAESMAPIIRPVRPEDSAAISETFLAARAEALSFLPRLHTDEETRLWIADTVLPSSSVWVAEVEGTVVGFCARRGEVVDHLYVHPNHQQGRLGTALLERARAESPQRLQLHTFARNEAARAFYERHGFRAIAFGHENEENEPDVLYEWVPQT